MVYERDIVKLVGIQTYKALFSIYPTLFYDIYDDGKKLSEYYIQLVQRVITLTGYTGKEMRNQLEKAVQDKKNGLDISNMKISALFDSSFSPQYYSSTFMTKAWWFLFVSLLVVILLAVIVWIFQSFYPVDKRLAFFGGNCDKIPLIKR